MELQEAWGVVRQALPDTLVAYALNVKVDELDDLPSDALDAGVSLLAPVAQAIIDSPDDSGRHAACGQLAAPSEGITSADLGLLSHIRMICGGSMPEMAADPDPVEDALLKLVRDSLPLTFFVDWQFTDNEVEAAQRSHASRMAFIHGAYADRDLRKLFPHNGETPQDLIAGTVSPDAIWSQVQFRSGRGLPLQLSRLPQLLTMYALTMTSLNGTLTVEAAYIHAREGLAAVRSLARRKSASLPLVVTLSYLELSPEVAEVDLSQGVLKRVNSVSARSFRLFSMLEQRPATAMLIGHYEERVLEFAHGPIDATKYLPEYEEYWREARRLVDKLRYSMLLANEVGDRPTPVPGLFIEVNPMDFLMTAGSLQQSVRYDLKSFVIHHDDTGPMIAWSRRVETEHPHSLDIAMKRIISAVTARFDAVDGFIDAVMAWENLFGDKQETMFKICASMAALLEPSDENARNRIFRELKSLYSSRSDIVHGAVEPFPDAAHEQRDKAIDFALQTIRQAYEVPGLLALSKSAQRAAAVLLHKHRPMTR